LEIGATEIEFKQEATRRNKPKYPNWIKDDEDILWNKNGGEIAKIKGWPERIEWHRWRLAQESAKAREMFKLAEAESAAKKVITPLRTGGLFEYLRSLAQMNPATGSQASANGTTGASPVVAPAPVAVVAATAGQDGGAAGVGYASPHGASESKGK